MITKWKATVVNPLGTETYSVSLDGNGEVVTATASSEKGTVQFVQTQSLSPLFAADIEAPMKTRLELEFSTIDFATKDMSAIFRVGEFSSMKVNLVRYE
jgi:hypothetical protein